VNALQRLKEMPQIPTMIELVKSEEGRQVMRVLAGTAEVGRAILTTPDVPSERVAALRAAFQAMLKDPQFRAIYTKRKIDVDPAPGERLDAVTRDTMKLPNDVVEALKNVLKG
jgi:tripartite-type tricarboxylate transporter receptor subunit TctC